jgi:hypothetical protein
VLFLRLYSVFVCLLQDGNAVCCFYWSHLHPNHTLAASCLDRLRCGYPVSNSTPSPVRNVRPNNQDQHCWCASAPTNQSTFVVYMSRYYKPSRWFLTSWHSSPWANHQPIAPWLHNKPTPLHRAKQSCGKPFGSVSCVNSFTTIISCDSV